MITYKMDGKELIVRIFNKPVGSIKKVEGGFQYIPKGQKIGGPVFKTVKEVQADLEKE